MKKKYLLLAISVTLSVSGGLIFWKWHTSSTPDVLGAQYAAELHKDWFAFRPTSAFPHYYEPKPDSEEVYAPAWLGHSERYYFNADGLNELYDYDIHKPADTYRIEVLGDSFTFGLFVNPNDNYTEVLERTLNAKNQQGSRFEVMNLGVPGFDAGYSVERFRLHGQKYSPDLVIFFVNRYMLEYQAEYIREREEYYVRQIPKDEIRKRDAKGEYYYPGRLAHADAARVSFSETLGREMSYISGLSSQYTGELLFVAYDWQNWNAATKFAVESYVMNRPYTRLMTDIPPLKDHEGLFPDQHPNEQGHRMIADALTQYLLRSGLISRYIASGSGIHAVQ